MPSTRRDARRARASSPLAAVLVLGLVLGSLTTLLGTPAGAATQAGPARVPLIIDTDMYSNTDDAGALATAFALELRGEVNVLAIGVDTRQSRPAVATNSWRCVAAIEQFYGFGNVPIGSDMPDNGTTVNSPDIVGPCAAFASPSTPAPQPVVALYRQELAAAPDDSVVMVGIGYEENLAALLDSPPDAISPLDGHDLVAAKVKYLTLMGGGYPTRSGENNFMGNPTAAETVASGWPTKIVYSGYEVGNGVFTGHTLTSVHPADSPVRAAYEALVGPGKNNSSYDLTAVYHAVFPSDPLLTEVGPGTNVIDGGGGDVFTLGSGDSYYLTLSSASSLASNLEGLLDVLPGTTPQSIAFTSTPPVSATVGGTYTATAGGGSSVNPLTLTIDPSSTSGCTIVASGDVSFLAPAGTCVIDANQAGDTTYAAAPQVQQAVPVAAVAQSIAFTTTPPVSATVGGTYTASATGGGSANPVTLSIDPSSTSGCTIDVSGDVSFLAPAGTCVIDANQAGNATYAAAPQVQQTVPVATIAQSIAFTSTPPLSATVGGTYTVTATGGGSANPVTFRVDLTSTSGCTVDATGDVSLLAPPGTCVIDANEAGTSSYAAAPQVEQTLAYQLDAQSIAFTSTPPLSATIGGTYTVTATGGGSMNPVTFRIDPTSTSGCTVDATGDVGLLAPPGTCVIDANEAGTSSYAAAPQAEQTLAYQLDTQAIAFTSSPPASATIGETYHATATGGGSANPVTFSIDPTSTSGCTVDATGDVSLLAPAGTCVIDANEAGSASFGPAPQAQQSFAVSRAAQAIAITSTAPSSAAVGGSYLVTASGGGSDLPLVFSIDASTTSGCTVNGSSGLVALGGPAGTCVVDVNQAGNASYVPAPQAQQSFSVAKATQTIVLTSVAPTNARVGGTYQVTATGGGSNDPLAFSIGATSTSGCKVGASTGLVTLGGPAGTCVVDVNQAGNASYAAAPQAQQTFSVAKATQSLTFTSKAPSAPGVGGTYVATATSTAGLAVSISVDASATSVCSLTGTKVTFLKPGTCVLDANQAGNASYLAAATVRQSMAVGKGTQVLSFRTTPPGTAKVGRSYAVSATSSSGLTVVLTIDHKATAICTLSNGTVRFLRTGTCVIDANQAGNASYLAAAQVQQSVKVS